MYTKHTIIVVTLLFGVKAIYASPLVLPDKPAKKTGIIVREGINIRTDARVTSLSIGLLHKGERVSIIEEKYNWYKIILPPRFTCYAAARYIRIISSNKGVVTATNLNLRILPSLNSEVIGKVPKSTVVEIIKKDKEWLLIKGYPFLTGWVHKKFIALVPSQEKKAVVKPPKKQLPLVIKETNYDGMFTVTGILSSLDALPSCPANYKLKNGYIVFFLYIPPEISNIEKFLNKKVLIHGNKKDNTCSYIEVHDISF